VQRKDSARLQRLPIAWLVLGEQEMMTQRSTAEISELKETTHEQIVCPVAKTAEIISGKWTLLIIRDLTTGTKRFSELERSLSGISPKTLSERLTALENEDVLRRHAYAEVPPKVEYSLTEKGQALVEVIEAMRSYGKQWLCCGD
jgi:DNA-binding HxlR family transcriptional regulator